MKKESTLLAERLIAAWFLLESEAFDSDSNNTWFEIYNRRWLGNTYSGAFYDSRVKQLPYETFRRVCQEMIADGRIKISGKNMKVRHRKEVKIREEHKREEKQGEILKKILRWETNFETNMATPIYG